MYDFFVSSTKKYKKAGEVFQLFKRLISSIYIKALNFSVAKCVHE